MQIKCTTGSNASVTIHFLARENPLRIKDFTADVDQVAVRYENERPVVFCGLGEEKQCTAAILRSAAARAAQAVTELQRSGGDVSAACIVPDLPSGTVETSKAIIEGVILGDYRFTKYKTDKKARIKSLDLVAANVSPALIRTRRRICEAVNYSRDLVNENASVVTPAFLASEAVRLARDGVIKATVIDAAGLKRKGLNLIRAVGSGSATPPVLIILEYRGASRKSPLTAIVGKGVTFDSGGQNLKPTGSIESMRHDMAGAAALLGLFSAVADIQPAINLIGVIPAVHNAIGSNAFFPGDIYESYAGKSVEIWSTDAEGRIILADAIAYCRKMYQPDSIIDLATLTGGIVTALGNLVAGLFSNDDELARRIFNSGERTGERVWRMPLYKEYCDSIKGDLGDLRNLSKFKKGVASPIIGAAFIKEFVADTPWAHIDIAGTAYNEGSARAETPQFATGFGVRLLMDLLGV